MPNTHRDFTHIGDRRPAVLRAYVMDARQPTRAFTVAVTVPLPRTTRPLVPTVVVMPNTHRSFTHVGDRRPAVVGAYVVHAHQPALTFYIPVTVPLAGDARPVCLAVVVMPRRP